MKHYSIFTLTRGETWAQTAIGLGLGVVLLLSSAQGAIAQSSPPAPAPTPFESVEFSPEDVLNPAAAGFQAIYVDSAGNVLGAFFAIPGARLKIHANGLVEIDQRDEANYRTDGRLRTLGDVELTYDSTGRLRSIDGTRFSYFSNGRPQSMGDVDFSYFSRGQLQRIEDVSFEYERNGTLKRISADQTRDGLPIVIAH
ncbi:hypothetical protein PGN35_023240 [Nodosilinea sp. PGN35]|uniref:hypothetical protein n=1 Tax=Nodosilinea sp. PGN35 TaxID=3020489 RepID=UPI00398A7CBB